MAGTGFQIKLGRIFTPDGHQKFIRLAKYVRRGAGRFGSAKAGSVRDAKRVTGLHFQRRVIVKFHLVKMDSGGKARQAQHLDYIARDSATREHEEGRLFDAHEYEVDVEDFKERSAHDPHQFRIIVSPEDSKQLTDLDAYTRDLMRTMESDMGTHLDWVAASHYDTATPHVHIVLRGVREDGRKLIIPRRYIAHGLREQAERLVTLELGSMPVREAGRKLARQVTQERLTSLDRGLLYQADKQSLIVDVGKTPSEGEAWTRRLDIARLKMLSRMGLAEKLSPTHWQLSPDMERTLKALGERGDILKAYHKALQSAELTKSDIGHVIYDPESGNAASIIGRVIKAGLLDDVTDRAYVVIEAVSDEPLYVPMGGADTIEGLKPGYSVELSPNLAEVKPSDVTIDRIARAQAGVYSTALHVKHEPQARPQFIDAHVRRLEALRRKNIVTRNPDGSWHVPGDYLDQVKALEARKLERAPVKLRILSTAKLQLLTQTLGVTWLDRELADKPLHLSADGFGADVRQALKQRREFLVAQKILGSFDDELTKTHLAELETRDMSEAGKALSEQLGKPYVPAPETGRLSGRLVDRIDRPSGRYALIERAKDFTLVPWRETLEKRRGQDVSAMLRRGQVNWTLGRKRGLDIS